MQRVMIVGGPGSGKSTLARALSDKTGLPVTHVDHIHWMPNWQERPKPEKIRMAQDVEARESWIFEGSLTATFDNRAMRADTLIWLDLPLPLCLWRVLMRSIKYRGQSRPDIAEGCVERLNAEFIWFFNWIWRTHRTRHRRIERLIANHPHLTVFLDVSRFDAAPLIAFIATKETNYGTETDGRVSC